MSTTYAGLKDALNAYFNGSRTFRIILLDGADAAGLGKASTTVDFLKLEVEQTAGGYERAAVNFGNAEEDTANQEAELPTVTGDFVASSSPPIPIQYDATALLVDGKARANIQITGISTTTLTAAGHGLAADDLVFFDAATGAIAANTLYYVLASGLTTNAFRVAATSGGSALSAGSLPAEPLICRYANGLIFAWQLRPASPEGDRSTIINPGQTRSIRIPLLSLK